MIHRPLLVPPVIRIPVADVTRAAAFYQDVLGLPLDLTAEEEGWASFATQNLPYCEHPHGEALHFALTDLYPTIERLEAADIDPFESMHEGEDGRVYLELRDPDGNTVRLFLTV